MRHFGLIAVGVAVQVAVSTLPAAAAQPQKPVCFDTEGWNGAGWYRCGHSRSIGLGWVGGGNGVAAVIGQQRPTSDFGGVDFAGPTPRFRTSPVVERYVAPAPGPVVRFAPAAPRANGNGGGYNGNNGTPSIGRFSPPVF